jgi:hypothetical protein
MRLKEVNFVQQRYDWDCVIACLAMWTDRSYEQVYHDIANMYPTEKFVDRGIDGSQTDALMAKYGMLRAITMEAWSGTRGILSFPSLNIPGGSHAIFYDGRNIHDPQKGREGKKWYEKDLGGRLWPASYTMCVDLNDKYTLDMYEMSLNTATHLIKKAKGIA